MTRAVAGPLLLLFCFVSIPARAQADWRASVAALLRERARAVLAGDAVALDATMRSAPDAFRERTARAADALRALGLRRYELDLRDDGYTDLADPREDDRHVVEALERIALRDDAEPAAERIYLTVSRDARGWSVIADDEVEDLDLLSPRGPWDFSAVRVTARGRARVLHSPGDRNAVRIATELDAAIGRVARAWPYEVPDRVVGIVPSSTRALARILGTTFDLGPFVAFASSSVERPDGAIAFGGHRVYVQPATYFRQSRAFQNDVLSHEVLHVATRAVAGPWAPAWLDEGVAQIYGERSRATPSALAARVRAGHAVALPRDFEFLGGSDDDIKVAYQASAHFIAFLNARHGASAGARLYRALGEEPAVAFGTAGYHLDRAARRIFDRPFAALERDWIRQATKELR